jgi:hypothetical protein
MFNQQQGFPFTTQMPTRNSNQDMIISSSGSEKSKKSQCVVIDSRNRNITAYPNPAKYQIKFNASDTFVGANVGYTLNNVYTVQLSECLLPKGFEETYPYLILKIPELDNSLEGTNTILATSFAVLIPDRIIGNTISCRVNGQCYCFKKFVPTLASLGKFTVEIYTPDGILYDFRETSEGTKAADDTSIQNMMIFEIVMKTLSRKMFNETIV